MCAADLCVDPTSVVGETCTLPFVLCIDLPVNVTGDTTLAHNDSSFGADFWSPNVCGLGEAAPGYGGNDVVYAFTPPETGVCTVWFVAFGVDWYAVSDCAATTDTCVTAAHGIGLHHVLMTAGTPYYFIADGPGLDGNGTHQMRINKCIPQCKGKVCGDDGCDGSCGTCGP